MDLKRINLFLWLFIFCIVQDAFFHEKNTMAESAETESGGTDFEKNRLDNELDTDLRNFRYKVDLILKEDQGLLTTLTGVISESEISAEIKQLRTFNQQDKTISSMKALTDRIRKDIKTIYQKLHTLGFYGAEIHQKIRVENPRNVQVGIYIDFGRIFNLKLNVKYLNQNEKFNEKYNATMQSKLRMFKASIPEIKSLIAIAIKNLQEDGFFKPKIIQKNVDINYESKEAVLNLIINPGDKVNFSSAEIKAFPGIDTKFIENRIDWIEGETFNIKEVESTVENLQNTQIFSSVKAEPIPDRLINGNIPMLIELKEDKKHMVDFTLLYSGMRNMNFEKKSKTQKRLKSVVGRLSWSNYNAFGGGEKLTFIVEGTPLRVQSKRADYGFETTLSQPDVIFRNNTANYTISRRQELTNVFFKKSDKVALIFNYPLSYDLLLNTGGNIEKNYVDGPGVFFQNDKHKKKYEDLSIPVEFVLNKTDDLLNPTSGYRLLAKFSEIFLKHSSSNNLMIFDTSFSYNYPLDQVKRTVIAFNVSRKSILGRNIDDIPLDKRIYAGGMNSVRGYANQMATEMLLGEDTPMGGKSNLEFNTEIRRKITTDFGAVLFFDGAKVFQNKSNYENLKTEKKRWFFSAGIGIRYPTGIGPIRADFAFPIKRRKKIDSKMQFIISLGQAF